MKKPIIIAGYKGIMNLDLTDVNKSLHKSLIEQHFKDIDLYKIEQANRKPHLRYENTIEKIKKNEEKEKEILNKKFKLEKEAQDRLDKERVRIFYNLQK